MFEITRQDPFNSRGLHDLVSFVRNDPFFGLTAGSDEGTLPLDVSEKNGDIIVKASLPGFDRKDIEVQIHDNVLTIKAEHTEMHEDKDETYYRRERRFGSVSRRVALPGVVSEKDAKAEFQDGVLKLIIPQAKEAKPKLIPIH